MAEVEYGLRIIGSEFVIDMMSLAEAKRILGTFDDPAVFEIVSRTVIPWAPVHASVVCEHPLNKVIIDDGSGLAVCQVCGKRGTA